MDILGNITFNFIITYHLRIPPSHGDATATKIKFRERPNLFDESKFSLELLTIPHENLIFAAIKHKKGHNYSLASILQ